MKKILINESYLEGRKLLEKDKLSYAVLFNVLGGNVEKIITDQRRYIIAHTAKVFPTWIWAPDDVTAEELEEIYQNIVTEFVPLEDYRFNTKYEIVKYLIHRFNEDFGLKFDISTNIVAYECQKAIKPLKRVDGYLQQMSNDDYELAVEMIKGASLAIGDRVMTPEESKAAAKDQLERKVLYVWRNKKGKAVSFCDKNLDDNYVKISQCYTPEEERGKGYAAKMIYELCEECIKMGQVPMLYADADYVSSNRCYQKIGFEQKGKIATIQASK